MYNIIIIAAIVKRYHLCLVLNWILVILDKAGSRYFFSATIGNQKTKLKIKIGGDRTSSILKCCSYQGFWSSFLLIKNACLYAYSHWRVLSTSDFIKMRSFIDSYWIIYWLLFLINVGISGCFRHCIKKLFGINLVWRNKRKNAFLILKKEDRKHRYKQNFKQETVKKYLI